MNAKTRTVVLTKLLLAETLTALMNAFVKIKDTNTKKQSAVVWTLMNAKRNPVEKTWIVRIL